MLKLNSKKKMSIDTISPQTPTSYSWGCCFYDTTNIRNNTTSFFRPLYPPRLVENNKYSYILKENPFQYWKALTDTFCKGTDEAICHLVEKGAGRFMDQIVLFDNYGPALDALETHILSSCRSSLCRKLIERNINPTALIPPRYLRIYPNDDDELVTPLQYNGSSCHTLFPKSVLCNFETKTRGESFDGLRRLLMYKSIDGELSKDYSQICFTVTESNSDQSEQVQERYKLTPEMVCSTESRFLREAGCLFLWEVAAGLGNTEIFKIFLDALLAQYHHDKDILSKTLFTTCDIGSPSMIRIVLNNGADPNATRHNISAIHVAILSKREPLKKVEILIQYSVNINMPWIGNDGISPLLLASQLKKYELVHVLLKNKADVNLCAPALGLPTPLFHCVYWGDLDLVKLLCEESQPDFDFISQSGESVFDIAHNSLKFAKAAKPNHISRLPLPNTDTEICEKILDVLIRSNGLQNEEILRLPLDSISVASDISLWPHHDCSIRLPIDTSLVHRGRKNQIDFEGAEPSLVASLDISKVKSDNLKNTGYGPMINSSTVDTKSSEDDWPLLCLEPFLFQVLPSI